MVLLCTGTLTIQLKSLGIFPKCPVINTNGNEIDVQVLFNFVTIIYQDYYLLLSKSLSKYLNIYLVSFLTAK